MKLPDHLAQRALDVLDRPLLPEELADLIWPDRTERDVTARKRAGHAAARDFIQQGQVVQRDDGTYVRTEMSELPEEPPTPDGSLAWENGQVVRVRKETIGALPLPSQRPAPPAAPAPPSPPAATLHEQYLAWVPSQTAAWQAWAAITAEVFSCKRADGTPLNEHERAAKKREAKARLRPLALDAYRWNRALGWIPPDPDFEAILATPPPAARPSRRSSAARW